MPLTWDDIAADRIREFLRNNFDIQNLATLNKDGMLQWIAARDVSLDLLFPPRAAPALPPQRAPEPGPKLDCPKMANQDDLAEFCISLETFFTMERVPDGRRPAFFLSSIRQPYRAKLSELIQSGVATYADLKTALLAQFAKSPVEYHVDFRKMMPHANESFVSFAMRLSTTYGRYAQIPGAPTDDQQRILNLAIIPRLIQTTPSYAKTDLNRFYARNPDATPPQVAAEADAICNSYQPSGPRRGERFNSTTQPTGGAAGASSGAPVTGTVRSPTVNPRPQGQSGGGNTNFFSSSLPDRRYPGFRGGASSSASNPVVCYGCNQPGHRRPDCPNSGNAARRGT